MFYKVFRSITVDNGVEFSDYEGMERSALKEEKRTFVFYCHPYSSWERGTNENNNRLIRRHIPKGVDFEDTTDEEIKYIETWINNYPRTLPEELHRRTRWSRRWTQLEYLYVKSRVGRNQRRLDNSLC